MPYSLSCFNLESCPLSVSARLVCFSAYATLPLRVLMLVLMHSHHIPVSVSQSRPWRITMSCHVVEPVVE